jgi:hypothetical protein
MLHREFAMAWLGRHIVSRISPGTIEPDGRHPVLKPFSNQLTHELQQPMTPLHIAANTMAVYQGPFNTIMCPMCLARRAYVPVRPDNIPRL